MRVAGQLLPLLAVHNLIRGKFAPGASLGHCPKHCSVPASPNTAVTNLFVWGLSGPKQQWVHVHARTMSTTAEVWLMQVILHEYFCSLTQAPVVLQAETEGDEEVREAGVGRGAQGPRREQEGCRGLH